MRFFMIGDVHMPAGDPQAENFLAAALDDMRTVDPEAALVVLGDNSRSGRPEEVDAFFDVLDAHAPARTFVILGNHDARGPDPADWNRDPGRESNFWPQAREHYLRRSRRYRADDGLYFKWDCADCRLVFLNTENGLKDAAELSGRQLGFLRGALAEGSAAGRSLFVFVHQALNDTHWHANLYGGFGEQDAAVKDILLGFPQAVFVCGHIHNGFGLAEAVDRPYGTQVEVPSFARPENGEIGPGAGYCVETSSEEIRLRARDLARGEWLPRYDVSLRVPGLPQLAAALRSAADLSPEEGELLAQADQWMSRRYEPYDRDDDAGLPKKRLYTPRDREEIAALAARIGQSVK